MFKKLLLTLTAFTLAMVAGASSAHAADLQITWDHQTDGHISFETPSTVAKTTITVKNISNGVKHVQLIQNTYQCDWGETAKPCSNNATHNPDNFTLQKGQSITRSLSRNTPTKQCGSAQVDFHVVDLDTKSRQGPFWGFAFTGDNCDTQFPFCPPRANVPPYAPNGDKNFIIWNGVKKYPDVGYPTGFHWIVGHKSKTNQAGADYVYFLRNGANIYKNKALQCFYPSDKNANGDYKRNIQTNWKRKLGDNPFFATWQVWEHGEDFGLFQGPYWFKNTFFN